MTDRTKEIIIKTLLVIAFTILCSFFPIGYFLDYLVDIDVISEKLCMSIIYSLMISFGVTGSLVTILLPFMKYIKSKPVKAQKFQLEFSNYELFSGYIDNVLAKKNYEKRVLKNSIDNAEISMYFNNQHLNLLKAVALIRVSEVTEELIDKFDEEISNFFCDYYENEETHDYIDLIIILCVDRITPVFHKYVNSNLQQEYKKGKLLVGISFGGKNIYISNPKGSFAYKKYKYLQKEFFELLRT